MQIERPARCSLSDLNTAETLPFQYNPAELDEVVEAGYEFFAALGGTFESPQYTGTKSKRINFSLEFDALTRSARGTDIMAAKYFLESLLYPVADAQAVATAAPNALLIFPNLYNVRVVIPSLSTKFSRFGLGMKPTAFVATLQLVVRGAQRVRPDIVRAGSLS